MPTAWRYLDPSSLVLSIQCSLIRRSTLVKTTRTDTMTVSLTPSILSGAVSGYRNVAELSSLEVHFSFTQFPNWPFNLLLSLGESLDFRHWIALTMKGTFPRGKKLYPAHYALLYYTRGTPRVFNKLRLPIETCRHCGKEVRDYGGHRDKMNPAGVNLADFWTDTSPNRHHKFKVRPGVNELKLIIPERSILISTNPGDLVFDPFGGGGSTYQAAEKHYRNWIGTELYDSAHIQRRIQGEFSFSAAQEPQFNLKELFNYEDKQDQVLRWIEGQGMPARTGTYFS